MPDRFTYDVFLSHNAKDKPTVRRLAERLKQAGLRVWFDEWVIKPDDDIYLAIERGLSSNIKNSITHPIFINLPAAHYTFYFHNKQHP